MGLPSGRAGHDAGLSRLDRLLAERAARRRAVALDRAILTLERLAERAMGDIAFDLVRADGLSDQDRRLLGEVLDVCGLRHHRADPQPDRQGGG